MFSQLSPQRIIVAVFDSMDELKAWRANSRVKQLEEE
jgi:hypothetical protein